MEIDVSLYAVVPFAEKGRSPAGCDCWGLVYMIFKELRDIELPLYVEDYANTEDAKELGRLIGKEKMAWAEVDRPQPFDVVVARLKGQPMHVGLYIGNGKMIHCMAGSGTSVEKLNSITWRDRIVGYYRHQ